MITEVVGLIHVPKGEKAKNDFVGLFGTNSQKLGDGIEEFNCGGKKGSWLGGEKKKETRGEKKDEGGENENKGAEVTFLDGW